MLKDLAKDVYIKDDYNCAETILRICNEFYHLNISDDDLKLVSGFGAGFCSGKTCGAVCGAVAALSKMSVTGRAHATAGFQSLISSFMAEVEEKLGSLECSELVKTYKKEEVRCLATVNIVADALEAYLSDHSLPNN